jgi:hypothetical protein
MRRNRPQTVLLYELSTLNDTRLPLHLQNLSPTNIAIRCCCKNRAVATATTATYVAIPALHVRTVAQNCTSATAEIAAICAKLSPRHGRLGRHFERISRFSHSHSYNVSSIIAFFYQPLTISDWLSASPPLLPTLPQKLMITDRDSHQRHGSHADFPRFQALDSTVKKRTSSDWYVFNGASSVQIKASDYT